jgi:hypothetical protein
MRPDRVAGRHLRSRSELARADLVVTHMLGRRGGWSGPASPDARPRLAACGWCPPRKGLRFAGLDYDAWSVVGWKAEYLAAVCRLWLQLEARFPGPGGSPSGPVGPAGTAAAPGTDPGWDPGPAGPLHRCRGRAAPQGGAPVRGDPGRRRPGAVGVLVILPAGRCSGWARSWPRSPPPSSIGCFRWGRPGQGGRVRVASAGRPAAPEPRPGVTLFVVAFFASPLILICWAAAM